MPNKHAKISLRDKTLDCDNCLYRISQNMPGTNIAISFCTISMPQKIYHLRGISTSNCKYKKTFIPSQKVN